MTAGLGAIGMAAATAHIASLLNEVADQLESARNPSAFLNALRGNSKVWAEIGRLRRILGWNIPQDIEEFALSASAHEGKGLSDHDVELLIAQNRAIAVLLAETDTASRPCPPEDLPVRWRELMVAGRHH